MNNLNNKGFTLVELLATIVILGIISTIAVVSIDKMLDHSKEVECDSILQSITNAAKEYVSDYRYTFEDLENPEITVAELTQLGYLTKTMKNPFNNKDLQESEKNNIYVVVRLKNDYTVRGVSIFNSSFKTIKCHIDEDEISEDKPANVVLFPG